MTARGRGSVRIGPISLFTLVIIVCLAVMAVLSVTTAQGLGLLRAIRAHGPTSKTAVIMLTGRADRELVQRAVQFGVNNYLVKPFTTQTLKEKIEAVFGPLT